MGGCYIVRKGSGGSDRIQFSLRTEYLTKLPDYGQENDIIVYTSVKSERYIVDSVKPTDVPDGTIWVILDDSSTNTVSLIPANRFGNAINVRLGKCMQYINGKWSYKSAFIFKNKKWIQFSTAMLPYFYDSKYEDFDNKDLTGGWTHNGIGKLIVDGTSMRMDFTVDGHSSRDTVYTNKSMILSDIKKVTFTVESLSLTKSYTDTWSSCTVGVANSMSGFIGNKFKKVSKSNTKAEYTIDCSGITGAFWPQIVCTTPNDAAMHVRFVISSITFE